MQEKYSVLMSVYYKENPLFLKQSLDSMIFQSVSPDEIVLICDGDLTDELNNILLDYQKKYTNLFNIIRLEKNSGLGYALKLGVENCKNEYIARMDTDDISKKDRCEKELNVLEKNPQVGIVGSNIEEINNGKTELKKKVPENHIRIKKFMKRRNPFNHSSVMYKKSEVLKAGNYKEARFIQDYFLWVDMIYNGTIGYNIQENLVSMRVDNNFYKRRSGKEYFSIQKDLLKYMKNKGIINNIEYILNLSVWKISSILPNSLRKILFEKTLRKKIWEVKKR